MRGRSVEQQVAYETQLSTLVILLSTPRTVEEIRDALAVRKRRVVRVRSDDDDILPLSRGRRSVVVVRPAAATIYARIEALTDRGYVVKKQKRRKKIFGKSGQRERVFSINQVQK